jgi:hypothetical protein
MHFTNLYKIWYTEVMIERLENLGHKFTAAALAGVAFLGASAATAELAPNAEAAVEQTATPLDPTPALRVETVYATSTIEAVKPTAYKLPNLTPKVMLLGKQILKDQTETLYKGQIPKATEKKIGAKYMSCVAYKDGIVNFKDCIITKKKHDVSTMTNADILLTYKGDVIEHQKYDKLPSGVWNYLDLRKQYKKGLLPMVTEHNQRNMIVRDPNTLKVKPTIKNPKEVNAKLIGFIKNSISIASPMTNEQVGG